MSDDRRIIGLSEFEARRGEGRLVTLGLGSCVAIVLHDPSTGTGGLAHVLLPTRGTGRGAENPGRYPAGAVPALLARMEALGAKPGRIVARLVGGASMFANLTPPGSLQIGERNVLASREVLRGRGIPVTGEQVGGDHGRSVHLDVASGRLEVSSVRHGVILL